MALVFTVCWFWFWFWLIASNNLPHFWVKTGPFSSTKSQPYCKREVPNIDVVGCFGVRYWSQTKSSTFRPTTTQVRRQQPS